MAQYMKFPSFVKGAAMKYFKKNNSPDEVKKLWEKTLEIYGKFVEEAPDIGGKENNMSSNLYLALAVFAFYEAADRKVSPEELDRMVKNTVPATIPVISAVIDFNKPKNQEKLRARYDKYKKLSDEKLDKGEWGNSWRVEINPHKREKGVAFDLVGCPLADFANSHGYGDILPILCGFDYISAGIMHARLIREHTVAEGNPCCDYWYVGDKEERNMNRRACVWLRARSRCR